MSASMPVGTQKANRIVPPPTLTFLSGPLAGGMIRLEEDDGTLGRREENDYVISDASLSRVHARITKRGGGVIVTDQGSSGGTQVNGEVLTGPCVLNHGDVVKFGQVECRFEDPATSFGDDDTTVTLKIPEVEKGPLLSPRQQQVLELIAEGMTNNQIGETLGITERTVKAYAQEVYDKLGVRNRAGAVAQAIRDGLLPGADG